MFSDLFRYTGQQCLSDVGLPAELALEDPPCGVDTALVSDGEDLSASEFGLVDTEGSGGGEDGSVAVELEVTGLCVGHPAESFESEVAGVSEDDQSSESTGCFVEALFTPVRTDAVGDDEMLLSDVNLDPESVGYINPLGRCVSIGVGGDNLGLHAELILPFAMPPDRSNGCGGYLILRSETCADLGFYLTIPGLIWSRRA